MRILHLSIALIIVALCFLPSRAQDAVLVLSPSSTISVHAGTGTAGFGGDGAAASAARLAAPSAMAQDAQGNLFIADTRNHRIRRVATNGTITTVAGTGTQGFAGDEGPANQAQLDGPAGIAVAADGTIYIADTRNHRIRHIDATGAIHTVAGNGTEGFSGDGSTAKIAQLSSPLGLALGLSGDLYIADSGNHRIRHLGADGTMATVAGDGAQGISPDGTQATAAHLDTPAALSVRSDGSVLIADRGNNRVLILQTDGTLRSFSTASLALRKPSSIVTNSLGDTLIADTGNYRITQVSSNGAGSALGSGVQGVLDPNAAPTQTAFGAPIALLDAGPGSASGRFSVIDHDASQVVQVSLPKISFADTVIATASSPRSLLLRNGGSNALIVSRVSVPTPYAQVGTSSCGTAPFQLAAGASCSLDLSFTPQTVGATSALLEVDVQNAAIQRVTLSGNGLRTGTQLASTTSLQTSGSLSYAGMPLTMTAAVLGGSTTSATGTVSFLDGTTPLGDIALNGAAQASLTMSTLPAGTHTLIARYNGDAHYLGSSSADTAITVAIPPDFTMASAAGNQLTLQSGSAGALALVLQPVSGVLNQTVTLSVDGLPAGSTINITPVPVTLASNPVTVNIVVKLPVSLSRRTPAGAWLAGMIILLFLPARRSLRQALLIVALAWFPLLLQGCGGGYLSGGASVGAQSAASTFPVTVVATCPGVAGATLTHSTTFTVVVQR